MKQKVVLTNPKYWRRSEVSPRWLNRHLIILFLLNLGVFINKPQSTHSCWKTQTARVTLEAPMHFGRKSASVYLFRLGLKNRKLRAHSPFNQGSVAYVLGKFKEN